jgi:hypothetical protein
MNSLSFSSTCQYLGSKYDPATALAYPSTANHCFHSQVSVIPALEHQVAYCLVKDHTRCPVYTQSETNPFPKNIMYAGVEFIPGRRPVWQFNVLILGVLLAGFVLWLGFQSFSAGQVPTTRPSILPVTSTSATPSMLPPKASVTSQLPTTTLTPLLPTPEPSLVPTEFPPQAHGLEIPIMVGEQPILMHRVIEGEQIVLLVKQYQTAIEVLQEINYNPPVPLFAGQVIVIAPGLIVNVDPNLPSFEPYQVTDKEISIEDLVLRLSVDLTMLKYYNRCSDACRMVKGDWLLIPRTK